MQLGELANVVFPWRRLRSAAQIRSDIDDEVRFHLEESARALEAEGLAPDAAQEEALARFGDVQRTKLDCLTAQLGSGIMVQKIQWLVIGLLVAALVALGFSYTTAVAHEREMAMQMRAEAEHARAAALVAEQEAERARAAMALRENAPRESARESLEVAPAPLTPTERTGEWRARFASARDDWREASATAYALIDECSSEEATRVLGALWSELSTTQKQQSLKAFAFRHHAGLIRVLDLGATDAELDVQNWAFRYLQDYAFENFVDDYGAYAGWHERWKDAPLSELLTENARAFLESIRGRPAHELVDRLRDFDRLDLRPGDAHGVDLARVLEDAGVLRILEDWLATEDEDAVVRAFRWARSLDPTEAWLRQNVLPELERDDPRRIGSAIATLGHPTNGWAVPELVGYLERAVLTGAPEDSRSGIWPSATALAEIGDASVIPTLIGLLVARPGYDTDYGIGYFGLGKLTGVSYDESHDGAWWVDWWSKNQGRFPPAVRAIPIPEY